MLQLTDEPSSIIAVQGLGAHPYYTCVKKQNPARQENHASQNSLLFKAIPKAKISNTPVLSDAAPTATDTSEVMLLRDLLPSFFPNARVATYSYKSDWWKDVETNVCNCGEQLLNVLYQNRSGEKVGRVAVDILSLMADNDDTGKWETAGFHWVPWSLKNLKRNSPILYQISRDTESSYRDADIVCFYEDTDGFASTKLSTSSFI